MTNVLLTLASILAYIAGIVLVMRITPKLLEHRYDEGWFLGLAALDIVGALLVFGAFAFSYTIFSGNFGIRVLDFLLLVGMLVASMRMAFFSLRPSWPSETFRVSRIAAVVYCLLLALASCYFLLQLFTAR
ncbi:MAG TPA: hypothetical protein VKR06_42630 [Ktedonosporobacter sp.]|nr:hypothetical protein [Ktedonosporobacter sp.]